MAAETDVAPRPGPRLEQYRRCERVPEGTTILHIENCSGLRASDLLLIAPGTASEEIVQIASCGSVHLGFPTRHAHEIGTLIARADAAPRYPGSGPKESHENCPDATVSEHNSLSSKERARQKGRAKRKQRAATQAAAPLVAPPLIVAQIRQPERFSSKAIPSIEQVPE